MIRCLPNRIRPALAFLLVLMFLAPLCRAGEVPESAYSRSMSMQPELLDHVDLVFLFPQRSVESESSEIFGTTNASDYLNTGSQPGVGVIGRTGPSAFFVLAQSRPIYYYGDSVLLQAGWGASWNAIRLGLALRGTRNNTDNLSTHDPVDPDRESIRTSTVREKALEGVIGLGFRNDRATLDMALELLDQEREAYYFNRDYHDTLESSFRNSGDPSLGIRGRFSIRAGEGSEIVAAGGWSKSDRSLEGFTMVDTTVTRIDKDLSPESWFGGLSFSFPTRRIDRISLFSFIRVLEREYDATSYSAVELRRQRTEEAWIGAALEHELLKKLTMRAGMEARYRRSEEIRDATDYNYADDLNASQGESQGLGFAWGATYVWKSMELSGAVSNTLALDKPLIALDARLFF